MTCESPQMIRHQGRNNRRLHTRIPMGLPVEVHLSDREAALTVELADPAVGSARFRAARGEVKVDQRASFVFFALGGHACTAEGRITRIDPTGEFIVVLDKTNADFVAFIRAIVPSLSTRA